MEGRCSATADSGCKSNGTKTKESEDDCMGAYLSLNFLLLHFAFAFIKS